MKLPVCQRLSAFLRSARGIWRRTGGSLVGEARPRGSHHGGRESWPKMTAQFMWMWRTIQPPDVDRTSRPTPAVTLVTLDLRNQQETGSRLLVPRGGRRSYIRRIQQRLDGEKAKCRNHPPSRAIASASWAWRRLATC
jgi:hypothetical protein